MTQLTDNLFAVEVPEGAKDFTIDMGYLIFKVPNYKNWVNDDILADYGRLEKHLKTHKAENDYKTGGIMLPPGPREFLFCTKWATEEDARKVVEWWVANYDHKVTWYRDYSASSEKACAIDYVYSIASLLRSKNLDDKKNWAVIRKKG
jgi:hypothetical protein